MTMGIWEDIGKGETNLGRLWQRLDQDTRVLAATSFYQHDFEDDGATHARADVKIATALNFRPVAVRKLPAERRARSIALASRLDPDLVSSILAAFHFEARREMMVSFLDALGIPHEDGVISSEHEDLVIDADRLKPAIDGLFAKYPAREVELYLGTLYVADREHWKMIGPAMEERKAG
jgi:hypothetical protein